MLNENDSSLNVEVLAQVLHWIRSAALQGDMAIEALHHPVIENEMKRRLQWYESFCKRENTHTGLQEIRKIMGKNFFGPEEFIGAFGLGEKFLNESWHHVLPFSNRTLHECADTHMLLAAPDYLSFSTLYGILEMSAHSGMLQVGVSDQDFYPELGPECCDGTWLLIRKKPLLATRHKSFAEQDSVLPADEKVPSARDTFYMCIAHRILFGAPAFPDAYMRTSTKVMQGTTVKRIEILDCLSGEPGLCWHASESDFSHFPDNSGLDGTYLISSRKHDT